MTENNYARRIISFNDMHAFGMVLAINNRRMLRYSFKRKTCVKSDEEYNDEPQTVMALGDSPPQQPGLQEEFGSDDEVVLLSELVSTSDSHVLTSSASTSSNQTVVAEPK
ncbi:hypothetical protein HHI36_006420 [Cryptolaemus montrouzieri]|uniref:Uncharacterized protein n=1 Tax=Cryptolaemus montrouzieri TaxID=559131 RepID=A0ABD2NY38_9CUCU